MDRAGSSGGNRQSLTPRDADFGARIRRLLHPSDYDESGESYDEADDSDADPTWQDPAQGNVPGDVIPDQESSEESNDDEVLNLEGQIEHYPANEDLPEVFEERLRKLDYGPPGFWYSAHRPTNVRTPARNIIRTGLPGIRGPARALGNRPNKADVWKLLFDENIMDTILINTNKKIQDIRSQLGEKTNKSNYKDTTTEELHALLGLLLLSSVLKSNDETLESVFSKDLCSRPIFSATMSIKRYKVLLGCLRFDDMDTRAQRKARDKGAPISEIFSKFIQNCQDVYCVSSEVTIDEMLIPFRGRCSFKMYMPKKPRKYGLKIMCLADAKTSYLLNAYMYTGKGSDSLTLTEEEKQLSVPTQSVIRLCQPIIRSNRNITADNWFTSMELVEELLKRNLTYVGTVKRNKREIPLEFLQHPDRPVPSVIYGFKKDSTLLSFVPKKNRAVILLSSMHQTASVDARKNKPEIISYYNSTKCGVDLLDMKCSVFSSSRRTRRWPQAIFYRLLNISTVNSFILYMSYKDIPDMGRFEFVKQLATELITPHLRTRLTTNLNLPKGLRMTIQTALEDTDQPTAQQPPTQQSPGHQLPAAQQPQARHGDIPVPSDTMRKRKTCSTCPYQKKRKTAYMCIKCEKPICVECSRKVCLECSKECK